MTKTSDEKEVSTYVNALLHHAEPLPKNPKMYFFGMAAPETMPADSRVEYYYWPTYLATGFLMKAVMLYPEMAKCERLCGKPDSFGGAQMLQILSACMLGCTGRHFAGAGPESTKTQLEVLDFFTEVGALQFMKQYPDLCPAFYECYTELLNKYRTAVEQGNVSDYWGGDCTEFAANLLSRVGKTDESFLPRCFPVFVYGTLMSGQCAYGMLQQARYVGKGVLSGYAMYDLGSFPGTVPQDGEDVLGEVYIVDRDVLKKLDSYEGEGSLYRRERVAVTVGERHLHAYAYLYNSEVTGKPVRVRWNMRDSDMVWYACYGSNIDEERFLCYLRGGYCEQNGQDYPGCADTTMWADSVSMEMPGRMYFANRSSSWQGGGVSFYLRGQEKVYMKLYLITYGQFKEIQRQEGASANWYGKIQFLNYYQGFPVFTLTSEEPLEQTAPGEKYLALLHQALRKEFRLNERQADKYLANCRVKFGSRPRKRI